MSYSNVPSEEEISLYQDIVRKEVEKFQNNQKDFSLAKLTLNELQQLAGRYSNGNQLLNQLIQKGMIIKICDKYRSAHMDLLAKVVHARSYTVSPPVALEYDVQLEEEYYPDFGAVSFTSILSDVQNKLSLDNLPNQDISLITNILQNVMSRSIKGKGFSSYQAYVMKQILDQYKHYIPVVAPTATGKTITFTLPAIVYVLEAVIKNEEPINVVFIYPRKALAKDQVERLLDLIYEINQELINNKLNKKVTLALEDGDTPGRKEIKDGEEYRGLNCPKCGNKLIYTKAGVKCSSCKRDYSFLLATREDIEVNIPNVLVTNLWTLYRRILNKDRASRFKNVKYIVLDEVHAYDNILTQHLRYILRLLNSLKALSKSPPVEKIVFSSATIPNHLEFLSSIVCCKSNQCISNIPTFQDFYSKYPQKGNKKRLILYLFLFPNIGKGIDTVTEYAAEVSLAWLKDKGFKGIVFADSVAGVTKLFKYFYNTILGTRKGKEIRDHICYTDPNDLCNEKEYYWDYLQNYKYVCADVNQLDRFAGDLKSSIELHNALLPPKNRWEIEKKFKSSTSPLQLLFSTSTLELGIDIGDIALIIQHKLPISRESIIQRIGRAGRSERTYRIATGIITLQTSPFATLYIYNQDLMKKLTSLGKGVSSQYGMTTNPNIVLQYMFSYLLLEKALNGSNTCVDDDLKRTDCEELGKNLVNELREKLKDQEFVKKLSTDLCIDPSRISEALGTLNSVNYETYPNDNKCEDVVSIVENIRVNLIEGLNEAESTLEDDDGFNELAEKILDNERLREFKLNKDYLKEFLYNIEGYLNKIFDELDNGHGYGPVISQLLNKLEQDIEKVKRSVSELEELNQQIKQPQNIETKDFAKMRMKLNIKNFSQKLEDLIKDLNAIVDYSNSLKETLKFTESENKVKCLLLLQKKNNISDNDISIDVFKVLKELFNNNIFIDLLMTPPAPVINVDLDTEEGDYSDD
ncbi:DEAD/DEAH box helicase [Stygiolobus sp. CP850M]|uniref:DEAD/DEAH box helicase n=1 Tax=Stygiolobus sp. CP850M TaxID=3133134 RepID=UPI00307CCE97